MQPTSTTSTRPYLVRAIYDWCVDNNFTPFIVVAVDGSVRVPQEFVQKGEIVLNVSLGATSGLSLGNNDIDFKARFGGVSRDISVPLDRVSAIYARENGQGMSFPVETASLDDSVSIKPVIARAPIPAAGGITPPLLGIVTAEDHARDPEPKPPIVAKSSLTRVK